MLKKLFFAFAIGLLILQVRPAGAVNYATNLTDVDGLTLLAGDAVQDVFVYDTTADGDGGAWRRDLSAQDTSWYSEICVATPCTRGTLDEFPPTVHLVLGESSLDIIDAETNALWMRFNSGSNSMIGADQQRRIWALDGQVFIAGQTRLTVLDFINDSAYYFNATDRFSTTSTISQRNQIILWTAQSATGLSSSDIRDVSAQRLGGASWVAAATAQGVNLINPTAGTVRRYYNTALSDVTTAVALASDGTLYYTNATTGALEVFYDVTADGGDQDTPDASYSTATTPALLTNPDGTTRPLRVSEQASTIDTTRHRLYLGSGSGVTVLNEGAIGSEASGSVKYLNNSFITEEMIGDVRGMWTLEDAAGDFQDRSGNGHHLTDNNSVTRGNAAVRGDGVSLAAASSHYLSLGHTADLDFGTGDFAVTGWVQHDDTSGGQVKIIDRTDGISIGFQLYIDTAGKLVGRVSDDGTNWDTVTSSSDVDTNSWVQFALVWEAGTSLTLFVNGLQEDIDGSLATTDSISGTTAGLNVGRDGSGSEYLDGDLDELMITGTAPTAQQVWDIYNKGNGALLSQFDNTLAGSTSDVRGISNTSDGRLVWVATNDGATGGALSVIKLGSVGDYQQTAVIDVDSADSAFLVYSTGSSPAIIDNDLSSVSAVHSAGREFLLVGSDASGASGLVQGTDWYVASESFVHGGVMNSGGSCKISPSYQICDSMGQLASGALQSDNFRLFDGYQYDDRDVVAGPPLIVATETTETTPFWQWQGVFDRSGVEGYYIRIGTDRDDPTDFMPARWLGNINHWQQDVPFTDGGTYYAQLRVRDGVGNEGAWGPVATILIQPALTFIIEGIPQGTTSLGAGTSDNETTTVSTLSNFIDFGTLVPNESKLAAQSLTVNMNVGQGYVVTAQQDHPLRTVQSQDQITSFPATNAEPDYWQVPALGHLAYHTEDISLNDVGQGPDRFAGTAPRWAGMSVSPEPIMYSSVRADNDQSHMLYRIQISPSQRAGPYTNKVTYILTGTF